MKRIAAIIITVCMALTGTCTGIPDLLMTGNGIEAAAAGTPSLKTITYKATGNQREDIIEFARTQIGYKEGSGNNTYFGKWFGFNYNPWCAMFVCWSANMAGVPTDVIPKLATADRSWGKKQKIYYKSKYWGGDYIPQKGDLIYFSWSVRDYADHIGMVAGTGKQDGTTYVYTIEGNKHDKVTEGSYAIGNKYILGYISPKYTINGVPEEPVTPEPVAETYTLKYRDGLDATGAAEDEAVIPPVTGTYGQDLTTAAAKYTRAGYEYSKWKIYREVDGKIVYLCRENTSGGEQWYQKSAIPENYTRVTVKCGSALNIGTPVSGTIYATPVWATAKYTVTYDANGGTGAPEPQKKTAGKELKLSTVKPARTGYIFKGWAVKASATKADYAAGASYTADADITLYAVWKVASYKAVITETVNARSGPGTKYGKVAELSQGKTVTIKETSNGWGKLSDDSWVPLDYTVKEGVTSYTLEYTDGVDATVSDASEIPPVTVKYGKEFTVTKKKFKRTGYHYDKWKLYRTGTSGKLWFCRDTAKNEKWAKENKTPFGYKTVKTAPEKTLRINTPVSETVYITPDWEIDTYKVTYDANGGKNAPKAQTKTYNKILVLRKDKPTRDNYKFLGWATTASASGPTYQAGGQYTVNKKVKLYAVWEAKTYKAKTTSEVNKRKGPGQDYEVIGTIAKGKTVTIVKTKNGWGKLKGGGWINLSYTKKAGNSSSKKKDTDAKESKADITFTPFVVKVTTFGGVNTRSGPGESYDTNGSRDRGENLQIVEISDGWGRIEDSDQWILLKYAKIMDGYTVEITADDLNQRSGPGENYGSKGPIAPGTYHISKIDGAWGKIKETGYWISMEYAAREE